MPSLPSHAPLVLSLTVILLSVGIAGCTDGPTTSAEPRFASRETALEAAGPTLMPSEPADSPIRAEIVAPTGYQALPTDASEFVVLLHNPIAAEPVENATVSVDAGPGAAARLAEDGHGVYAGNLTPPDVGPRSARLTAILDDGSSVTFPIQLRAWASTRDAGSVDGLSYEPIEGDGDLRLKLVHPEEPLDAAEKTQPLTFVIYDAMAGEVVEDAEVEMASWMPPHGLPGGGQMQGHGTHSEVAPTHERFGVYQGRLNYVMNGTWWTNVTVTADGETTKFRLTADIGKGSHSHGDDGHDDHDHAHSFDTFLGALSSHGPKREMTDIDGTETLTAKLLQPSADGAPTGNQTVKLLLHQPEADRPAPVAVGHVELDIHKHGQDGGISDANVSEVVHSGHGVWTADTNLTEEGTWEFHLEVETFDGDVFSGSFQVGVGGEASDGHDHGDHDHG